MITLHNYFRLEYIIMIPCIILFKFWIIMQWIMIYAVDHMIMQAIKAKNHAKCSDMKSMHAKDFMCAELIVPLLICICV